MTHPTLQTALCTAMETLINRALAHDPATSEKLKAQQGRCVALALTEPSFDITLHFTDSGVTVSPIAIEDADCHLSGKAKGLLSLINGPKKSLAGSDLRLSGHTGFLMELLDIAKQLDVDWEAWLAQQITKTSNKETGDILGYSLAKGARYKAEHIQRIASRSPAFFHDFIVEELRATPSKSELQYFYKHVDETLYAAERMAARINNLHHKLTL